MLWKGSTAMEGMSTKGRPSPVLLDNQSRPYFGHQPVLADKLAARRGKHAQQVQRAAAKRDHVVLTQKPPPAKVEAKRTEADLVIGHDQARNSQQLRSFQLLNEGP